MTAAATAGRVDKGLVEAARLGDAAALERLLVVCRPNLRRYASLTCLTAADAEDAVQETLLIVYRNVAGLRSALTFGRWVFQIVRRECLRRMQQHDQSLHSVQSIAEENRYLATRSDFDLRLDLTLAIQSLPPLYRDVIVLRDFEEMTIREIADALNLVPETVKTRIYRGRQLVREHLLA